MIAHIHEIPFRHSYWNNKDGDISYANQALNLLSSFGFEEFDVVILHQPSKASREAAQAAKEQIEKLRNGKKDLLAIKIVERKTQKRGGFSIVEVSAKSIRYRTRLFKQEGAYIREISSVDAEINWGNEVFYRFKNYGRQFL